MSESSKKTVCPYEYLLNATGYDYSDCCCYGSSDCNLTMDDNSLCTYSKEFEEDLKFTLSFKHKL